MFGLLCFRHIPDQILGSLKYMCHTRPDIAYGVGLISRYMEKDTTSHLIATKRILRYVKGTCNLAILTHIRVETKMTGKILQFMCLCMEMQQYHGVLRRKP